ncbi:hypothetical protein SUGI_1512330 [Cryptomeria japonica]|uniref:Uncharacterized protein n=1 Tax=Cryptomeria japonica TaxID=3369 RepID=A0AAD3NV48_CRYJA|nr:hypothetical protein SUGI_1512330 [Cryptomeria japonica]
MRGRGRPLLKPDSFRARPQNTSRPPSIHVDDFIDLYGDNSAQSSSARYSVQSGKSSDYRGSSRGYPSEMGGQTQNEAPLSHRHPPSAFFSPQQPLSSSSPYSNSGSRSQQHLKPKYMKMK